MVLPLEDERGIARVRALLRARFTSVVDDPRPLSGGQFSRAFAFDAAGQAYVVRLSIYDEGFAKDDYAWRHFATPALPIPRVVATGQWPQGYFAISERCAGQTLDQLTPDARQALRPAALAALDAIGRADVSASRGYGFWDRDGAGGFASWREYLAAIVENRGEGFYRDWHALFRDSFLEREVYDLVYRSMLRLVDYCPEERALIHADYHDENILAAGGRITGVIDWANACYGDPLYDVAWLGWWSEIADVALLRERYGAAPHYEERIACYWHHIGLDDLRYYARTGQRARYEWGRHRLLALAARWSR